MALPAIRIVFDEENPVSLDLVAARFNTLDHFAMLVFLQYRTLEMQRDSIADPKCLTNSDLTAYTFPQRATLVHRITYRSPLEIVLTAGDATAALLGFLRGLRDSGAQYRKRNALAESSGAEPSSRVRVEQLREMAAHHAQNYLVIGNMVCLTQLFRDMDERELRNIVSTAPSEVEEITLAERGPRWGKARRG